MLPNDCKKKKEKKRRKKEKNKKEKEERNKSGSIFYCTGYKKKKTKKNQPFTAILLTNFQHVYYPNHEISNKRLQSHLQLHVRSILL